ncbi:MAG: CDP-diacylglycerol--serine O-phosphatidyltransferase [Alphaproteobacteria bacterium]|nr:MAG: CDP-diacylglycerol--serine O-phosphatidyltransferase [Alphaproteobacteria bacterium]
MTHVFPPFEPEQEEGSKSRRRRLAFRRGQVPIRVLVPSIFTILAICAGLTAIRMAIEGRYDVAIAAIVLAAFLDGIDGRVARLLKASSRFGAELDSLADFVNFGVAPAIIIFTWALGGLKSLGWIAVLFFAVCAALRLARFNVSLDASSEQPAWQANYFVGVPAPAGALVVLLPLYVHNLGIVDVRAMWPAILVYTVAIGFLMVSRVPTYSGKLIGQRVAREYVLPVFLCAALFVALLLTYPYIVLASCSLAYLAVIPLSFLRYRAQEQRAEREAGAQNGSRKRPPKAKPAAQPESGNDRPPAA